MMNEAVADLAWLAERGALAGVAGIIRERRNRIEQDSTVATDREQYANGGLLNLVTGEATGLQLARMHGQADPATDQASLALTGALAAAEIDRLLSQS